MFLDFIIQVKHKEVEESKRVHPLEDLKDKIKNLDPSRNFLKPLIGSPEICLIAEIKKASPSLGLIRENFDPVKIARLYEEGGASALSVLTETNFFQGKLEHLSQVKEVTSLPLLRKDFIFDEYQIYESRAFGADALLLIAALLDRGQMEEFLSLNHSLGMYSLVEVHNEEELEKALEADAQLIGINNRDLRTFKVDLNTTLKLMAKIPKDRVVVSESGIKTRQDVLLLQEKGVKAILVGESLMKSPDIKGKIEELLGGPSTI